MDRRGHATTRPNCGRSASCGRGCGGSGRSTRTASSQIVNGLLREDEALPQLVKHDEWSYHLHATPPAAPLATRMAVEAAMAMVDVVRSGELRRLRICEYHDCDDVVVDLSKNRSKRFCDDGCGNRAAVAAYRARKTQAAH